MTEPKQPPEWAPHRAVWIGFPSDGDLWGEDLAGACDEVFAFARAVADEGRGEAVRLICATSEACAKAERMVAASGVKMDVLGLPFFDIWLRDTGPIVIRENGNWVALDHPGNGWGGKYPSPLDDAIGQRLAQAEGLDRRAPDWILEGGAIDQDGAGLLVTTEQCLLNPNRNPTLGRKAVEDRLRRDFGVSRILWLGDGLVNDHTDGHVDNLARFAAPGRLLLPVASGEDDPNADVYADAWARARTFGLEPAAIPSPGRVEQDGAIVPASYMNFYIGNQTVVVPVHGTAHDAAAVAAIAAHFPDRRTIGLPSTHVLSGGGSFHCISQQIPA